MPNLETIKPNISPEPTPEQLATMKQLREELGKKIAKIDEALRNRGIALEDKTLRKDERAKIEESFDRLEAHKNNLLDQMPEIPVQQPEGVILNKDGIPFNKQPDPVVILDMYGNPIKKIEEKSLPIIEPTSQPVPQSAPQPPQQPQQPVQQPTVQPTAPTIQQIVQGVTNAKKITTAPATSTLAPITPASPTGPTGPTSPTTPPITSVVKTPEQILAEKIRKNEPLTREDLILRRTKWAGPDGVEAAIMKLYEAEKAANPPVEETPNFIEHTGPNLERARYDYVYALFQNRNNLYPDKVTYDHVKNLEKIYNQKRDEAVQEIQPIGNRTEDHIACKKERLKFLKDEHAAFEREALKLESQETRDRINKAIDRALNKTGRFIDKTQEKWNKGMEKFKNFFTDDPNTKGVGWLYYFFLVTHTTPLIAGNYINEKIGEPIDKGINTLRQKFKDALSSKKPRQEAPEQKKTLSEKYGDKDKKEKTIEEKSAEEVEAERKKNEIETRKMEFLSKATGVEMKGRNLDAWIKLSDTSVGKFFNPSRYKKPMKLEDYPDFQRKIHDALLPAYDEAKQISKVDRTKDIKGTDKLSLKEFINKLAEQDKLKDLWTKASNSNS